MNHSQKKFIILLLLAATSLATLLFSPLLGVVVMPPASYWSLSRDAIDYTVLWDLRVPRTLFCFLVGALLSLTGLVFQSLFRNPLATPYTLGVSSGGALGAIIAIKLGLDFGIPWVSTTSLMAMAGAFGTILLVYSVCRRVRGDTAVTMLLSGVILSFFFGSLIVFLQFLSNFVEVFRITRWLMGSVEVAGYQSLLQLLPFGIIGVLIMFRYSRDLTLLSLGEEMAESRGVDAGRVMLILFFASSLVTGAVVSLCGPIGFVGIMIPHVCRALLGYDYRWLMPASLLSGGAFLVFCDALGRTIITPSEIPVGIVTALLGGPFFLWILTARRG